MFAIAMLRVIRRLSGRNDPRYYRPCCRATSWSDFDVHCGLGRVSGSCNLPEGMAARERFRGRPAVSRHPPRYASGLAADRSSERRRQQRWGLGGSWALASEQLTAAAQNIRTGLSNSEQHTSWSMPISSQPSSNTSADTTLATVILGGILCHRRVEQAGLHAPYSGLMM
jgi:hypothetical protein